MPVTSSAAASANSGAEQLLDMRLEPEIEPRLHRLARRAGEMLVGDDAHARPQHVVAGDELADRRRRSSAPRRRRRSTNCSSGACDSLVARASISPASAFCAAACSALASEPPADASGAKMKPSSRPIAWPSTTTSPVLLISVSSIVFSRSRRISTLVRRSTKRSVSRSCSASDSLSSTRARDALPMLRDRQASPDGWRRRSRSGYARCGSRACRYRRRSGRPARPGAANQSVGILPSRIRNP